MKVVELLKIGGELLKLMSENDVKRDDYQYVKNYLKEAEREVPKQKKRIKDCKALIAQLDTGFQERQQTEERFAKLEETQKEQGGKLDQILELLKKNK